jgi:hypothetical protein
LKIILNAKQIKRLALHLFSFFSKGIENFNQPGAKQEVNFFKLFFALQIPSRKL